MERASLFVLTSMVFTIVSNGFSWAATPPPFRPVSLPFNDEQQALCIKNGSGINRANGPLAWWAKQTGACTGMSLVTGAALSNTRPTDETYDPRVSLTDRYTLAARLARMGCSQKVEVPSTQSLFTTCDGNKRDLEDLVIQQNATKVISEISPAIVEKFLNKSTEPRKSTLNALKKAYHELKEGRPALLILKMKSSSIPHTVLVTGIEAASPPGVAPAVILKVYDSNWNFEGPFWPKTSRVVIPFEVDWSQPLANSMALFGFAQYGDALEMNLEDGLEVFTLWDESKGAPSAESCCALVRAQPSVFSAQDRAACTYPKSDSFESGL